jgi:FlaA1/EpsC-like NDP-sugar epimerase
MILGKRSLLLIGGSGDFGSALVKRFIKSRFKKWKVFNIDFKPNENAGHNFILDETNPYA